VIELGAKAVRHNANLAGGSPWNAKEDLDWERILRGSASCFIGRNDFPDWFPALSFSDFWLPAHGVKKPNREERQRMCVGKRRYRSQGDALDAAAIVGVERRRKAYLCPLCRNWHLTST
jgi:hypothetical protein